MVARDHFRVNLIISAYYLRKPNILLLKTFMFLYDRGYMSEHDDSFSLQLPPIEAEKMSFEDGMHA